MFWSHSYRLKFIVTVTVKFVEFTFVKFEIYLVEVFSACGHSCTSFPPNFGKLQHLQEAMIGFV